MVFSEFEFENTYLDGSPAKNTFQMDYPAIFSLGLGYSIGDVDLALDFRRVDYENTDGFSETGWTPTASVAGFGWENISILSAGLQYKGINKYYEHIINTCGMLSKSNIKLKLHSVVGKKNYIFLYLLL